MKTSEIYALAQMAVLNSTELSGYQKLEILRELMDKEDVALYWEKREEGEVK
jgi:hypothetical protein